MVDESSMSVLHGCLFLKVGFLIFIVQVSRFHVRMLDISHDIDIERAEGSSISSVSACCTGF